MHMAGKRLAPHNSFIQFLMDNYRNAKLELEPKERVSELADAIGWLRQTIQKYDDCGVYDVRKRRELVEACRIDIGLYIEWAAKEISGAVA